MRRALRGLLPLLFLALASLLPACGDRSGGREVASACCDCLIEHECTPATREECGAWALGKRDGPLPVDPHCQSANGCGPPCAEMGATWVP